MEDVGAGYWCSKLQFIEFNLALMPSMNRLQFTVGLARYVVQPAYKTFNSLSRCMLLADQGS